MSKNLHIKFKIVPTPYSSKSKHPYKMVMMACSLFVLKLNTFLLSQKFFHVLKIWQCTTQKVLSQEAYI